MYVRPFPNIEEGGWLISRDGGYSPAWAPDGQKLFYRRLGRLDMMAVAVATDSTFRPGSPEVLFPAPNLLFAVGWTTRAWDPSRGDRFLMIKSPPPRINVVLSWTDELLDRVPVN